MKIVIFGVCTGPDRLRSKDSGEGYEVLLRGYSPADCTDYAEEYSKAALFRRRMTVCKVMVVL